MSNEEIDYKEKLKIMKKVSNIHLTEEHIRRLYEIYEETIDTRDFKEILDLYVGNDDEFSIFTDLSELNLLDGLPSNGTWRKFKINAQSIQLIEKIKHEENKKLRDKLLDRTNKQSPLRPFIAIIISLWALAVAIFK